MVKNSRTTASVDALRPLNAPLAMQVKATDWGAPMQVRRRGLWMDVGEVVDRWRIDDEWWREDRVSRTYFQLLMQDGQSMTVFRNDVDGTWYWQHYG